MARILIIDDSLPLLDVMEHILNEAGHHTVACESGRQAIVLLETETFDLIITDVYMPEGDGFDVMSAVKRREKPIPVVAISGMTGKRNLLPAAERLGAVVQLAKPFSGQELLLSVEQALEPRGQAVLPPGSGA